MGVSWSSKGHLICSSAFALVGRGFRHQGRGYLDYDWNCHLSIKILGQCWAVTGRACVCEPDTHRPRYRLSENVPTFLWHSPAVGLPGGITCFKLICRWWNGAATYSQVVYQHRYDLTFHMSPLWMIYDNHSLIYHLGRDGRSIQAWRGRPTVSFDRAAVTASN